MKPEFVEYEIISKNFDQPGCAVLQLKPKKEISFKAGQFLPLIFNISGEKVLRDYSICSTPGYELIEIAAKKFKNGLVSNYIFNSISAGDILKGFAPKGEFIFEPAPEEKRNLYLFAAGSGITPIISILRTALKEEPHSDINLVYQNSSLDRIIFKKELDDLTRRFEKFNLIYSISRPPRGWVGYHGRINAYKIGLIFKYLGSRISERNIFYICSPPGMMHEILRYLTGRGISMANINREMFGESEPMPKPSVAQSGRALVEFIYSGQYIEARAEYGRDLLESGLLAGVDLPYSCHKAVCMSCVARLAQGEVTQIINDEENISGGDIFLCRSYPKSGNIKVIIE